MGLLIINHSIDFSMILFIFRLHVDLKQYPWYFVRVICCDITGKKFQFLAVEMLDS